MPWIAFVPLIRGVCSVFGTFEMTSKPTNAASTRIAISVSRSIRGAPSLRERLSRPGETFTTDGGVIIAAPLNVPSSMAEHASQLYGRNVLSLLELMTGEGGALQLNWDDEVIAGACITRGGEIVHERAREVAEAVAAAPREAGAA